MFHQAFTFHKFIYQPYEAQVNKQMVHLSRIIANKKCLPIIKSDIYISKYMLYYKYKKNIRTKELVKLVYWLLLHEIYHQNSFTNM